GAKLEELRERIDSMDDQLIDILAKRMAVSEEIGRCKRENNISIFQRARWDDIVRSRVRRRGGGLPAFPDRHPAEVLRPAPVDHEQLHASVRCGEPGIARQ
ncbi:MAG: chorismate mutase, partial [Acidobacteriia bacterium]|nr:chorismate mutase [Terriglobia bacterium]